MASITGVNHLLLLVRDMQRTADFYINVLGLRLRGTSRQTMNTYPGKQEGHRVHRIYFFETADGTGITCAEVPTVPLDQTEPVLPAFWPGSPDSGSYGKVDHLALNVNTREELLHFQKRLRENGYQVSEIVERKNPPKFVKSIYFHSPDGYPMEIATWDATDPEWADALAHSYMNDPDPVPAVSQARVVPPGPPLKAEI